MTVAKGVFKKVNGTPVAVDGTAREMMRALPSDKTFIGEFRTVRHAEQHALYWSLCALAGFQTDTTSRAVSDWLLEKTNTVEIVFHPDGKMKVRPKSIAWESMEQAAFDEFFQRAVPLVADLLQAAPKDVLQAYYDLLDPDTRAATIKRLRRILRKPESAPMRSVPAPPLSPPANRQARQDCQRETV